MRRVLVLEPDEPTRRQLLLGLRERGIQAEAVASIAAAAPTLLAGSADILLAGPGAGAVSELLPGVLASPSPTRIVALVDGDSDAGLRAIRQGAADFVAAGDGMDRVVLALRKVEAAAERVANGGHPSPRSPGAWPTVARDAPHGNGPQGVSGPVTDQAGAAIRSRISVAGNGRLAEPKPEAAGEPGAGAPPVLVGGGPKIAALLTLIRRLAGVKAAVLVGGESGTGKELVAQALHAQSPWRRGPFVAVNCGAIPSGLFESELFGHVRGAFTDAVRDKQGLFEAAHGGTLFLDEIADLPLALQSKLLRVVQDGVIRRLGDVGDLRVEVRVVAATARDLSAEVAAGRFREDLYYRLAGLIIQIPPLRERREDIPALALHFLARARARLGLPVNDIEPEALRLLVAYAWPGNVRELENTIERAAILSSGDNVDVAGLPERVVPSGGAASRPDSTGLTDDPGDPRDLSIKRAARRIEEGLIRRALAATGGNRTRAAVLLEISHRALLYKMKDYGIVVAAGRSVDPD